MQDSPLFYNLNDAGLIKVSGTEAKKLLQGQLTCDIEKITQIKGSMAAHCNPQGRVMSLFYLFLYADSYYLLLPQTMISACLSALKKYAVFFKVDVSNVSNSLTKIGYFGSLPDKIENVAITNIPTTSRYIFIGEEEAIKNSMDNIINDQMKSLNEWQYLDITDGIPSIYPETIGKFLPHELNLPNLHAVDFEKGCYTGQEIIARMHYRGKLKNFLYKASIFTRLPLLPGADIYSHEDQHVHTSGILVDVYKENLHHYYTLIITDETHAKNQKLFLNPAIPNITKNNEDVFLLKY